MTDHQTDAGYDREDRADELITLAAKAVGGLQMIAHSQTERAETNERNRLNLLHLHGAAGMYVGPLFAAIGTEGMSGTTWTVLRHLPWMPYSMGALFFIAGLILYEATTLRSPRWEIFGLLAMSAAYAIIAVSFTLAVVLWVAEWDHVYRNFVISLLLAETTAVLIWAVRPRRFRHSLVLNLSVGWAVGFAIGVLFTPDAPGPRPSFYAHGVYAHLSAILIIHLLTLAMRVRRES